MSLRGKNVLITGAAVRLGRAMALYAAEAGANILLHYGRSKTQAKETLAEIKTLGVEGQAIQADLSDGRQSSELIKKAASYGPLFALVNSASIFQNLSWDETDMATWEKHLRINLTAPFLLSQAFAKSLGPKDEGRIVNILDWRALRPGADHFPYTVSKAGLAALTRSLSVALAPNITVNGIAFGAILPPSTGGNVEEILKHVPAQRWAELEEVKQTLLFLLDGPKYITGEIIHLDGGRHAV